MLEDEEAGNYGCDNGKYGGYGKTEVVECPAIPERCFDLDWRVLSNALSCRYISSRTSFVTQMDEGVVADWKRHCPLGLRSSKGQVSWWKNILSSCSECPSRAQAWQEGLLSILGEGWSSGLIGSRLSVLKGTTHAIEAVKEGLAQPQFCKGDLLTFLLTASGLAHLCFRVS